MTALLVAFTPHAFVAPPTRLTPSHSGAKLAVPIRSRVFLPRMGFLDQFKEAFVNEPELEKARKQGNKKTAQQMASNMALMAANVNKAVRYCYCYYYCF